MVIKIAYGYNVIQKIIIWDYISKKKNKLYIIILMFYE